MNQRKQEPRTFAYFGAMNQRKQEPRTFTYSAMNQRKQEPRTFAYFGAMHLDNQFLLNIVLIASLIDLTDYPTGLYFI